MIDQRLSGAFTAYRRTKIYQHWDDMRGLHGDPDPPLSLPFSYVLDRARWGRLGHYVWLSRRVPGWTRDMEAVRLVQASFELPPGAVVVELGSFLGCSAILLAGARKLRRSGIVHCVDPFDASGDAFSAGIYQNVQSSDRRSLRDRFDRNIRRAGVGDYISVHAVSAEEAIRKWTTPIDLLFLDGHQSYEVVTNTYDEWRPHLKTGGTLVVHNSRAGYRQPSHDGFARLVEERIHAPDYHDIEYVNSTTFARKVQP